MPRTYGALGPAGENDAPFSRQLALLEAMASRRGPGGPSFRASREEAGDLSPMEQRDYSRRLLEEKIQTSLGQRNALKESTRLERDKFGLSGRELESKIADEMAKRKMSGREFDFKTGTEFPQEMGLKERQTALGGRALDEQIRAAFAGEGTRKYEAETGRMEAMKPERGSFQDKIAALAILRDPQATPEMRQAAAAFLRMGAASGEGGTAPEVGPAPVLPAIDIVKQNLPQIAQLLQSPNAAQLVKEWVEQNVPGLTPRQFRMAVQEALRDPEGLESYADARYPAPSGLIEGKDTAPFPGQDPSPFSWPSPMVSKGRARAFWKENLARSTLEEELRKYLGD